MPSTAAESSTTSSRSWTLVAGLGAGVIAVCYGFARYAYGLFVPRFAAEYGLSGSGLGVLSGLCTAGYVLGLLLAPRVARRSPRSAVIGAGFVAAVGLALMGVAGSVAAFAVGLVVAGSSAGLVSPAVAEVIVRGVADVPARARAQTWANTGTSFGLAAAAFTPVLAVGWHTIWLGFAGVAAVVAVVAALRLPADASGSDVEGVPPAAPVPPVDERWPRGLVPLLLNAAMIGLTSAPFWTFFIARIGYAGVTGTSATWCWFAIGAVGPLGGLAGYVSQRFGLRATNIGTWTLWAAGLGLLSLPGLGLLGSLGAAAVLGATYMALTGLCILWGSRLFPAGPSHGVTLAFLSLGVGQTAGSAVAGTLADRLGLGVVFVLAAALSSTAWAQLHPGFSLQQAPMDSLEKGNRPCQERAWKMPSGFAAVPRRAGGSRSTGIDEAVAPTSPRSEPRRLEKLPTGPRPDGTENVVGPRDDGIVRHRRGGPHEALLDLQRSHAQN